VAINSEAPRSPDGKLSPVALISAARTRIARTAAIRAAIYFLTPALTAIILAATLPEIARITWERIGYFLKPELMMNARLVMLAAGLIAIFLGAYRGWRAYSAADDFVGAAIAVDARMHANEQIVTLATLSNPDAPQTGNASRSPLFPMLWRNVSAALQSFNPETEFAAEVAEPIKKSSLPSAAIAIALGLAMLALVRPPSPLENTALQLTRLAARLEASATTPEEKQLAQQIKKVAANLTNPKVPPEQKKQDLDAVLAQVQKKESATGDQSGAATGNSKGSGAGSSSASSAGGSEGKGEGGQSQDQNKGTGKGEGKGGTGSGSAQNQGGNKNGKNSGTADSVELKNELAKAQAQVQTEDLAANQAPNKPDPNAKTAQAPQPGNNPNQQGGSSKNPNEKGSAPMPVPQAGNNSGNQMPQGQGQKPHGGVGGDTHLGEFPTAANYQRFLKPGEAGAGLHLNDARYVVFKIPSGPTSGGDGKTVIDTERPKATTAYTNAPLAPTADTAPPDERQLVPPRYRDLIR
jgi:hypothetical protein